MNVKAGIPIEMGTIRESQIDALVEAKIKSKELDSTYEEQSKGLGL